MQARGWSVVPEGGPCPTPVHRCLSRAEYKELLLGHEESLWQKRTRLQRLWPSAQFGPSHEDSQGNQTRSIFETQRGIMWHWWLEGQEGLDEITWPPERISVSNSHTIDPSVASVM